MLSANLWAVQITSAWKKSLDAVFKTGRLLLQAKAQLKHGEFQTMVRQQLPFGPRMAQMLMKVAGDSRLTNAQRISLLPPHVATLYQMSRLPDDILAQKFADGTVRPEMQCRDIAGINFVLEQARDEKRVAGLAPVAGRFRTLVADPPWPTGGGRGLKYATMSQADLLNMPVPTWAEDSAHLYLWSTNGVEIPNALALIAHWGFEFKTTITWVKPHFSMGAYFRSQTELCLFAIRGGLKTRAPARSIPTFFEAPVTEHSAKPPRFYEIVRTASYPNFGEAFQRTVRPDFVNLYEPAEPMQVAA